MKIRVFIVTIFAMLFIYTDTAHAYLDPGTGSAIIQAILAVIVTVGLCAKQFWYNVLVFFRIKEKNTPKEEKK